MKYLKVFVDFAKDIEGLTDTEAGRLFRAMLKYADTDEELNLRGAEKILWPVARKAIDNQREAYAHQCAVNKQNITNRYEPLRSVTNGNESKQDKEKDKDKDEDTKQSITPIQSFVHSDGGDAAGLERLIDGLQLDLFEGTYRHIADAVADAIRTMYNAESIRVNGRNVPQGAVRSVLSSLTIDHIDFIIRQLEKQDPEDKVTNGRAYLMACIYNAPADCAVNDRRESWR